MHKLVHPFSYPALSDIRELKNHDDVLVPVYSQSTDVVVVNFVVVLKFPNITECRVTERMH